MPDHRSHGPNSGHRKRRLKKDIQPVTDADLTQPITETPASEAAPAPDPSALLTLPATPVNGEQHEPQVEVPAPAPEEPDSPPPVSEPPAAKTDEAPGMPKWEELFPEEPAAKPPKSMGEAFARFYVAIFKVPAMMNLGNQWPLNRDEAIALASSTADAVNALPKKSNSAVVSAIKALTKVIPFLTLPATAWIIVAPRVQGSIDLVAARRAGRESEESLGPTDQTGARYNQSPGSGASRSIPTWEDFVRRNH